jgi:hypothetical protein
MGKIEYVRNDAGDEVAMQIGSVIRGLDMGEQRLLWQALTSCVLGPMLHDDDDLLHVMSGRSANGKMSSIVCKSIAKTNREQPITERPFSKGHCDLVLVHGISP